MRRGGLGGFGITRCDLPEIELASRIEDQPRIEILQPDLTHGYGKRQQLEIHLLEAEFAPANEIGRIEPVHRREIGNGGAAGVAAAQLSTSAAGQLEPPAGRERAMGDEHIGLLGEELLQRQQVDTTEIELEVGGEGRGHQRTAHPQLSPPIDPAVERDLERSVRAARQAVHTQGHLAGKHLAVRRACPVLHPDRPVGQLETAVFDQPGCLRVRRGGRGVLVSAVEQCGQIDTSVAQAHRFDARLARDQPPHDDFPGGHVHRKRRRLQARNVDRGAFCTLHTEGEIPDAEHALGDGHSIQIGLGEPQAQRGVQQPLVHLPAVNRIAVIRREALQLGALQAHLQIEAAIGRYHRAVHVELQSALGRKRELEGCRCTFLKAQRTRLDIQAVEPDIEGSCRYPVAESDAAPCDAQLGKPEVDHRPRLCFCRRLGSLDGRLRREIEQSDPPRGIASNLDHRFIEA